MSDPQAPVGAATPSASQPVTTVTTTSSTTAVPHTHGEKRRADQVVLYCMPRSFFLWLLILVGFIGAVWVRHSKPDGNSPVIWGWIYLVTLVFTIFALVFDVGIVSLLVWTGVFIFLLVLSAYLKEVKIYFLSHLAAYLGGFRPKLDAGFASVVSWILLLPWIGSMFQAVVKGRKVFTPNSIEERVFGQGVEVTDRSGLKFRTHYRDLQETLLGLGAGDLEAVDQNQRVVKRWENVVFLAFQSNRLEKLLLQRAVEIDSPQP